ncbi:MULTISPECIES: peptidoglycan-binding domain-containing protein [unclassified Streptomyces]|uniref:peptidoglycan-binding domain-containing protein n=1 Tax=unclassified Streptomyces TaxID=2593676 RepID=UPI002253A215|nr:MULTISPECIES: peptidoglycan-binding domain-containing protein [unclassified Streptomyces]MCX4790731.1 peptidoglycan-binding protein [Streptomyces sp. NBC_01221]WSP61409.1 peptidoglycan-binding protein [Streptomyces sp. NBC_01240]
MQYLLRANGFDVKVDADYGPATAEAVKKFQASRKLPGPGIGDEDTWRALLNAQGPDQHK